MDGICGMTAGRKRERRDKIVNFLLFRLFPLTERRIPCKMEAEIK